MMVRFGWFGLAFVLHASQQRSDAFSTSVRPAIDRRNGFHTSQQRPSSTRLYGQFDISKPVFDLYSLRNVRGDALTKYNSLNQSEPLRINLALLFAFTFLASPWLAQEINEIPLSLPQTAGAVAGVLTSSGFFVKECQARSRQLTRLEKELEALQLPIRLPTNALADTAYQRSAVPILPVLKANNCRVVAISGAEAELATCLEQFRVLGRRLQQADTFVVIVPTDGSSVPSERFPWLADASNTEAWKKYFESLSEGQPSFRWFGLTPAGRSFGSGTTVPSWLQVLGKSLSPVSVLDEDDVSSSSESEIAGLQRKFYAALTEGLQEEMTAVFDSDTNSDVSDVIEQGGRLDTWNSCLQDDARPAGMKISGSDVTIVSEDAAYSTCIEFPSAIQGATLLAVQKWKRKDDAWKLEQHQTIPWNVEAPAAGTLLCDCRGCVSLVRTNERRTFGGLLG